MNEVLILIDDCNVITINKVIYIDSNLVNLLTIPNGFNLKRSLLISQVKVMETLNPSTFNDIFTLEDVVCFIKNI
jgi:hypothetical protein